MSTGLYNDLVNSKYLVYHQEVDITPEDPEQAYKVIQPEIVPFISYPYEWSFSQLKVAALLTLEINKIALEKGTISKDGSAYNIQFINGKPILIDTLSFEVYKTGSFWDGYKQFCQHFLAPLTLAAKVDIWIMLLSKCYNDGILLDQTSNLLPESTKIGFSGINVHIHLYAKMQQQYANKQSVATTGVQLPLEHLVRLIESLRQTITALTWQPEGTEWGDYYSITNYSNESFDQKRTLLGIFVDIVNPSKVLDLCANNGVFSKEISKKDIFTVSSDIEPAAVEKNYLEICKSKEKNLLPLVTNLTNPSPAIGWANQERESLVNRGPFDLVCALALIHHLAISNKLPFPPVAEYSSSLGKWVIVEFVPKSDSQVNKLLSTRKNIFAPYNDNEFQKSFTEYFDLVRREKYQTVTIHFIYLGDLKVETVFRL